jgi:hypothetical protein
MCLSRAALRALAVVLAAGLVLAVSTARADEDDDSPSPWHLDVDVGYGRSEVQFVVPASYAGACDAVTAVPAGTPPESIPAAPAACAIPSTSIDLVRTTIGVGHGGFTLEASMMFDRSALDDSRSGLGEPYLAWSAGVRLDSSSTSFFALTFRFAYVRRETTGIAGEGGRASIGILLRLMPSIIVYGEASIDATTVPSWMSDGGALFSYTSWLAGGVRFELGH